MNKKLILFVTITSLLPFCCVGAGKKEEVIQKRIEETSRLLEEEKAAHQKEKEQFASAQRALEGRMKTLEEKIDGVQKECQELAARISETETSKKDFTRRTRQSERYFSDVRRILLTSAERLQKEIEQGLPYLLDERIRKIKGLKARIPEQDLLPACEELWGYYLAEIDLGYDSEVYPDEVETQKGEIRKAEFLRVGKSLLAYRTKDGEETAILLKTPGGYRWRKDLGWHQKRNVRKAIEMLRRKRVIKLLEFPISVELQK